MLEGAACQHLPVIADAEVVVNARGNRIHLDPTDERAAVLRARGGDLNPASLRLWQQLLSSKPWDLVVDVGANYGEMLLGAVLPEHAVVIAFEPNERIADHLERSLRDAGMAVEVQRVALAEEVGSGPFVVDATWSGSSRLVDDSAPSNGRVPTTTLDEAIGHLWSRRACIKIDVEGAEDRVLAGGRHVFPRLDDLAIHIEILHRTPDEVAAWTDAWRVYLYDLRTATLVRVDGGRADQVAELLEQPWIYRQDAVLRRMPAA